MSNSFDELFEGLRGQQPPSPFAPAAAVRRRGRQRANRQAVSIGVAVFVVTGLGAGGVVAALGEPDAPVPPATPPPTVESPPVTEPPVTEPPVTEPPVPTEVSEEWFLTASDLPGTGWQRATGETIEGLWFWDVPEDSCPGYRIEDFPSIDRRVDIDVRGWLRDGEALLERVDQVAELFEPEVGAENLDDVRAFIELCSRRPEPGDEAAPTYYEIEDTGLAGDESLLIRAELYQFNGEAIEPVGEPEYVAVVRVGDAVTTIRFLNVPQDAVREVAQAAADRLGQ
jgi:hypothetical protein